jgi:hypothetical protein
MQCNSYSNKYFTGAKMNDVYNYLLTRHKRLHVLSTAQIQYYIKRVIDLVHDILGWCIRSCGFCLVRLFPNKNCMLAIRNI